MLKDGDGGGDPTEIYNRDGAGVDRETESAMCLRK